MAEPQTRLSAEKRPASQNEESQDELKEDAHQIAERGHAATDIYGNALIHFDPKAEARLRLKIDLYIIPTVFLLYL